MLGIDPSVNHSIKGCFDYGIGVSISEGANLIVPSRATLRLGSGCHIGRYVELGPSGIISIGESTSVQDRSILVGDVTLGRYCMLSLNVLMTSGVHYYDRWPHLLIRDQDMLVVADPVLAVQHSRPITLGEDCWIGMNAVIMPGVTIGRGCVVGSNAVVTCDLPPYSVAVGVPARVIKQRLTFAPPKRINWIDPSHYPYFYSGFELSCAERESNLGMGGHVARGSFEVWVDGEPAMEICLTVRAFGGESPVIEHEGVHAHISDEWQDYRFSVGERGMPARFSIRGTSRGVVVSGAWIA
jgi:acetyltransferase-like isoleucine patch superfamily enzyme